MRHPIGLGVPCVPRPDVTDGAGGQGESGSSNLLPGIYRPRLTVKLAASNTLSKTTFLTGVERYALLFTTGGDLLLAGPR